MIGGMGLGILVEKRIVLNTTDLLKVNDKTSTAKVEGIRTLSGNIGKNKDSNVKLQYNQTQ